MNVEVRRLIALKEAELEPLRWASYQEGYAHIGRLIEEWRNGSNRFDAPHEALFGVYVGERLVGVGGLSRMSETTGRVRRVYVLPEERGAGRGSALVRRIIRQAAPFEELVLYTAEAGPFYERLGFLSTGAENPTHRLVLPNRTVGRSNGSRG